MLESASLTRAWVALALKVMTSVPPVLLSVPSNTPESTACVPDRLRLPLPENTSCAEAPPWRLRVTLAPL